MSLFGAMSESEMIFHLMYLLIWFCIVYPPTEFDSLGLTIDKLLAGWLGSPQTQFIGYQLKRTSATLVIHTFLPFFYVIFYSNYFDLENEVRKSIAWQTIQYLALFAPVIGCTIAYNWSRHNWERHPIVQTLKKFSNNRRTWLDVGQSVNIEFQAIDNLTVKCSAISTVYATENWIVKTTLYGVCFAHQSDCQLVADRTDSHRISHEASEGIEFVNIQVKSARAGVAQFSIRINALHFRELQDRLRPSISILESVRFRGTIIDHFIDAFKEEVLRNPPFVADAPIIDSCYACLSAVPNVKLQRRCESDGVPAADACGSCYCRPMWCDACLARWFAARQQEKEKPSATWLRQKCQCPMCRATFCLLDVSPIEFVN